MAKKKKKITVHVEAPKQQNWVAKHAREFNVATVETDRKKEAKKKGYANTKHKKRNEGY